jgi:DtxR family Mn-dependent transcriptional regulator
VTGASTSIAVDDYLKVIYSHTEWQSEPITPSQLAVRLALAPSSVTEMVKKLAALGLVEHRPYRAITLTPAGEERALAMVRRHRLVETWLVRDFAYGWDEVHDEAEVLEHALSDRLLAAIDAHLGYPVRDPHGDVIPAADGSLRRPQAVRLDAATPGLTGTIVRISDRDPEVLRVVDSLGLAIDDAVTVVEAEGAGARLRRRTGGTIVLAPAVAMALWIGQASAATAAGGD